MRIRTAIEGKKHATSELAPSTFALSGDNSESSIYAAPQTVGHSFSNLSVVQPPAHESGDYEEQARELADQVMWMEKPVNDIGSTIPQIALRDQRYTQRAEWRGPGPQVTSAVESAESSGGGGRTNTQQNAGNLSVQRMFQTGSIQAKLAISEPGDASEEEADRIADHVMRTPEPIVRRQCAACASSAPCANCEAESIIQRNAASVSRQKSRPTFPSPNVSQHRGANPCRHQHVPFLNHGSDSTLVKCVYIQIKGRRSPHAQFKQGHLLLGRR